MFMNCSIKSQTDSSGALAWCKRKLSFPFIHVLSFASEAWFWLRQEKLLQVFAACHDIEITEKKKDTKRIGLQKLWF